MPPKDKQNPNSICTTRMQRNKILTVQKSNFPKFAAKSQNQLQNLHGRKRVKKVTMELRKFDLQNKTQQMKPKSTQKKPMVKAIEIQRKIEILCIEKLAFIKTKKIGLSIKYIKKDKMKKHILLSKLKLLRQNR